jgi:hypothetical protein
LEFNNSSLWGVHSCKDNLKVSYYIGPNGVACIKGSTVFDFSIHKIYSFLMNDSLREKYTESMVDFIKVLGHYEFNTYVCHTKIKAYYIISSRDFVGLTTSA